MLHEDIAAVENAPNTFDDKRGLKLQSLGDDPAEKLVPQERVLQRSVEQVVHFLGRNERPFFSEASIRGFEFSFLKNSELLKFSRQHVDRTVFINDQICDWQSICSEEIVHRASFLMGESVVEATSGGR